MLDNNNGKKSYVGMNKDKFLKTYQNMQKIIF